MSRPGPRERKQADPQTVIRDAHVLLPESERDRILSALLLLARAARDGRQPAVGTVVDGLVDSALAVVVREPPETCPLDRIPLEFVDTRLMEPALMRIWNDLDGGAAETETRQGPAGDAEAGEYTGEVEGPRPRGRVRTAPSRDPAAVEQALFETLPEGGWHTSDEQRRFARDLWRNESGPGGRSDLDRDTLNNPKALSSWIHRHR